MVVKALKYVFFIFCLAFSVSAQSQSEESIMAGGQALLERGAYSQAVTAFRQVLARDADNFEAQFNLAFAYLQWGRNSNAVEEFKKALQHQSKNSQIWANLAIAYENLGKKEESLYALNQAVSLDPQNITARMNLAATYMNADRTKQAMEQYRKVIEIDGTNEDALVNLAKCLIGEGQYDEATKYLKQISVSNPNNGEAHYELGNILWKRQNDKDKALTEYKLAVTLKPENLSFYDNYVALLIDKGDKAQAVELLKKSLVYTDDVLRKDKIQAQINKLETGGTAAPTATGADGEKLVAKDQTNELQSELRKSKTTDTRRLETKPVNVMGDLEDISSDTSKVLDLKGEAKKRAAK